jgi:hypothetical protein
LSKQNGNEAKMQVLCGFRKGVQKNYTKNKTPGQLAGMPGRVRWTEGYSYEYFSKKTANSQC